MKVCVQLLATVVVYCALALYRVHWQQLNRAPPVHAGEHTATRIFSTSTSGMVRMGCEDDTRRSRPG